METDVESGRFQALCTRHISSPPILLNRYSARVSLPLLPSTFDLRSTIYLPLLSSFFLLSAHNKTLGTPMANGHLPTAASVPGEDVEMLEERYYM